MDKYFNNVDVTIRDYNDPYGRSEQLSEENILQLASAIRAIRNAEHRLQLTVDRVCNPYG